MHRNEQRLAAYERAASAWAAQWPAINETLRSRGLIEAHRAMVERARHCLPFEPKVTP